MHLLVLSHIEATMCGHEMFKIGHNTFLIDF